MERRLIVMRHGKSSHDDPRLSDHQRPLNKRGWREAAEIAERLVELGWVPQHVVSSDSLRTEQTWEAMEDAIEPSPTLQWEEAFYLAGMDSVYPILKDLPDQITDVLILGHNPGWESVVSYLSSERERMTTSNAALLHGTGDSWEDALQSGSFELVQMLRPRSL